MDDEADTEAVRPRRKVGQHFPRKPVQTYEELRALLDEWEPKLRRRARRRYQAFARADVDAALRSAMARMLQAPSFEHPLQEVINLTRNELRRMERRRKARQGGKLVIPGLGAVEGRLAELVVELPPVARDVVLRFAAGESAAEIARKEEKSQNYIRVLISKTKTQLRRGLHGLVILVPRRLRFLWQSLPPQSVLVPLIAGSLFVAPVEAQPAYVAAQPSTTLVSEADNSITRVQVTKSLPSPSASASTAAVTATRTSAPLLGAAAETPDDVRLTAAATPSSGRPVVVAIGRGRNCDCEVLLQSLDGGASWTATDGPPREVNQIVLPPNYPGDPRIFGGVDAISGGAPYVAAGFGKPFDSLQGVPAGQVAVSSRFNSGDPRLFVAGLMGVWSTRLDGSSPIEEVAYPTATLTSNAVAALATPKDGPAVFVWAPAMGFVPNDVTHQWIESTVLSCASTCSPLSPMSVPPGRLAAGTKTLLVYGTTAAFLSSDGGDTFAPMPLPAQSAILAAALVNDIPWIAGQAIDGSFFLLRGPQWQDVGSALSHQHATLSMMAVGSSVIDALQGTGYRCTGPVINWLPRCLATK